MKKFLTLAALATLGYAAPASAADVLAVQCPPANVTELTDGARYLIYDVAKVSDKNASGNQTYGSLNRGGLAYANSQGTNILSDHSLSPNTMLSVKIENPNQYIWEARRDDAGNGWKFYNVGSGTYITQNQAAVSHSDAGTTYTILDYNASKDAWRVGFTQGTTNYYWDGTETALIGWNNAGDCHWFRFVAVDDEDVAVTESDNYQTFTVNFKENDNVVSTSTVTGFYGHSVKVSLPAFYDGSETITLPSSGSTVDVSVVESVPFKYTAVEDWSNGGANMIWQAAEAHGNAAKYMWTHNDGGNLSDDTFDRPNKVTYPDNQLWAFIGSLDGGFKIVNKAAGEGMYLTYDGNIAKMVASPEYDTWKIYPTTVSYYDKLEYCCFKLKTGDSEKGYLNHNSYAHNFQVYGHADEGSSNRFFSASDPLIGFYEANLSLYQNDEEATAAYNAAKADRYNWEKAKALETALNMVEDIDAFNLIVANAQAFIDLGLCDEESLQDYTDLKESGAKKTPAFLDRLREAFANMVAGASLSADNVTLKFRNTKQSRYMAPNANGNGKIVSGNATETAGRTAFTLKHAADANSINLNNEYTNKYLKSGNIQSVQATLTDAANATVYTLKLLDVEGGRYGIAQIGKTDAAELLHTDGSNNVVNWRDGENTRWYLELVDEATAAKEHFEGGKVYYNGLLNSGSTAVGEYSITEDGKAAADAAIAAGDAEGATAEVVRASADALWSVETSLNMPVAGHFYRFICADNSSLQAMSALPLASDANRMQMADNNAANALATIFYLDEENHLVALSNGRCLGKFMQNDKGNSWKCVLGSNEKAANVTFQASAGQRGAYNIIASAGRYLHGSSDKVDCGGSDGAGYRWTIQEVNWLPIPGSNESYTTICMPVALNTEGKKLNVLTAEVENGRVVLTPFTLTNNVIPANTPLVLHTEMDGTQRDATNNLVYLMIDRNNEGTVPAQNALKGQTLA
ncbi:MAG: hypothetical protein K2F58_01625, partial [Muribaculaceae bacterium]|nr:hypothetical protein [Muribaculaceae bacterium]